MRHWLFNRYIILPALAITYLNAQFTKVDITMDDRLLKNNDRQVLLPLKNVIEIFFINTTWDEDWDDLGIELYVQIIFQGTATKNGKETFLAQVLFSTKTDQRFFDNSLQFYFNPGGSLYYDPVMFEPLPSFLSFYGNMILAGEIDTYQPNEGSKQYELARSIALRGSASNFSMGWSKRIQLTDDMSTNYGLRKARFAYYYGLELFEDGEIEESIKQFKQMIVGIDEVYDRIPREHYTLYFLKSHATEITQILQILRQPTMIEDLIEIDPSNKDIYAKGLKDISP
jgi:hypothetical protein